MTYDFFVTSWTSRSHLTERLESGGPLTSRITTRMIPKSRIYNFFEIRNCKSVVFVGIQTQQITFQTENECFLNCITSVIP